MLRVRGTRCKTLAENARATPNDVNGHGRVDTAGWAEYAGRQPEVDNVRRARRRHVLGDGTAGDSEGRRLVARMGAAAQADGARMAPAEESVFKSAIGDEICFGGMGKAFMSDLHSIDHANVEQSVTSIPRCSV